MKRPWMKFYPSDWLGDRALAICSSAAKGLWMDMIALMHGSEPYGHLVLNGQPLSESELARLTRNTLDDIRVLLMELKRAGVFSMTRAGVIYSRRMVRDEKRAKDGRIGKETRQKIPGSRNWQALEKKAQNSTTLKVVGKVNDLPPSPQKPEARSQIPESRNSPNGESQSAKQIAIGMVEIWNRETAGTGLRAVQKIHDTRIATCRRRYHKEFNADMDEWRKYIRKVVASAFLLGNNDRIFRADFDWVLKPANLAKIVEGNYDDREPPANKLGWQIGVG